MNVEKPIPCSLYDIQGLQEWLDEMALQGLFLVDFSRRLDQVSFRLEEPRPVRYRLDPVVKPGKNDPEREDAYAQMGWEYVCHIPRYYHIFCCADPEAPELYSDRQSLSLAMDGLVRREIRQVILCGLLVLLVMALPLLADSGRWLKEMVLWDNPRYVATCVFFPILMAAALVLLVIETRKLLNIRRTLAQGLPLKAKRRWNRPRYWTWYIPLICFLNFFPRLFFPNVGWDICGLEDAALSHSWPTVVQTEALGPRPLEAEPYADGYVTTNSSWLAPVQEFASIDWEVRLPGAPSHSKYWTGVRYVRARSPKAAGLVFQIELDDASETLNNWAKWGGHAYHITGSTAFTPWDRPDADRLEVARYRQMGRDCWTFAALRGTDILVVNYIGFAQPEDCIGLFLDALDQKEEAP